MITARSPLRISLGGGGTDLPVYYERFGGLVVSVAITAACHVRITRHPGRDIVIESRDYGCTTTIPAGSDIAIEEPLSLPRAVLTWFDAHRLRPVGIQIVMWADVSPGSGLGSSSAMTAALVSAIGHHAGLPLNHRRIAEIACEIEIDLLQKPIGRQDQYASAMGGVNVLSFSKHGVNVTPCRLRPGLEQSLQDQLLLFSTGTTRDSATLLRPQREASEHDDQVIARLHRIKQIAAEMRDVLMIGDIPAFGALLDESWSLKRVLANGVTSPDIDRWYALARGQGAYGGKIVGAGGGGHFLFCVPPKGRRAVSTVLRTEGLIPLPVTFDKEGCVACNDMPVQPVRLQPSLIGALHETANANSR